jgi:paraquat-inducible protein A
MGLESEPTLTPALHADVFACVWCGQFQRAKALAEKSVLICTRCGGALERRNSNHRGVAWVCIICAALLLLVALTGPLFELALLGNFTSASVLSGPRVLSKLGMTEAAVVVVITLIVAPVIHLGVLVLALLAAHARAPRRWLLRPFALVESLRRWSMIEVFLLAACIAYVRLRAWTGVSVGLAPLAFAGVMLAIRGAEAALDLQALWERVPLGRWKGKSKIDSASAGESAASWMRCERCGLIMAAKQGQGCARCGHKLFKRKRHSVRRTWALVIGAILLIIPANVLPVMSVTRFGRREVDTIMSGVVELTRHHLWGLALVIFLASIVIPVLKLLALIVMLVMTRRGSGAYLRERTRVLRVVHGIGRWSMVDVFSVMILVSLLDLGRLATVLPGYGVVAFGMVVILTMLASEAFDSRLMWDAAGLNGEVEAQGVRRELPRFGT